MAGCGCLPPEKGNEVVEILEIYADILEDKERAARIKKIGDDIKKCKCPSKSSAGNKSSGKKREPSAYNKHTSVCMKSGKSMKECAVEWNKNKKRS